MFEGSRILAASTPTEAAATDLLEVNLVWIDLRRSGPRLSDSI